MTTRKATISIPAPCHEDWDKMTVAERGRFCGSCQKHVYDFTKSSDREILQKFNADKNICGRFLDSQLDRQLFIPKTKLSVWLASASAVLALIGGSQPAHTQINTEKIDIVERTNNPSVKFNRDKKIISGDVLGSGKSGATILIKNTIVKTEADNNGHFSLRARTGDILVVSCFGYYDTEVTVLPEKDYYTVIPDQTRIVVEAPYVHRVKGNMTIVCSTVTAAETTKIHKHTFVGRILCNIANVFRREEKKHK
jgi:hypothetical protein